MFHKFNLTIPELDIARLKGSKFGTLDNLFPEFIESEVNDPQYFLDACKDVINFNIKPDNMNITVIKKFGANIPHTDVWPVAFNFYIHANNNDITTFYNNPSNHRVVIEEVPGLYEYDINKLIISDSFCAKTNDCYLLNTHRPHSVSNFNNESRTLLRLMWYDYSYDTVLNSIQIL